MGRERRGELTSLQKKEVSGEAGMRGERRRERLLQVPLTFALSVSGVG